MPPRHGLVRYPMLSGAQLCRKPYRQENTAGSPGDRQRLKPERHAYRERPQTPAWKTDQHRGCRNGPPEILSLPDVSKALSAKQSSEPPFLEQVSRPGKYSARI